MTSQEQSEDRESDTSLASELPLIPAPVDLKRASIYRGLSPFYKVERWIAELIRAVIFVGMMGLGLIVGAQILLRYVFAAPLLGIEELAPLFALWAYFGGMAYATRQRTHVVGGILRLLVSNARTILIGRVITTLLCLLTTAVLLYFTWDIFLYNVSLGRQSPYMRWPWALWGASMISGFVLMILYFTLQLYLEIRASINPSRLG